MKEGKTDITVVMDKSGSMGGLVDDVIGGFNQFLDDQIKVPGEAVMSLILFDTSYKFIYTGTPLAEVPRLSHDNYRPGGNTALLDAVARGILDAGARLEKMDEAERPEKVVFVIMTDGQENSSVEHSREQVKEMIKHQEEKYAWLFVFIGANIDAFAESGAMNVRASNAMNFGATGQGVGVAMCAVSDGMKRLRGTKGMTPGNYNYFTAQEQQQGEDTKKGDAVVEALKNQAKTGRTKSRAKKGS